MSSPFAAFANATLRFQVASSALVIDANGNPRPGTAVVEVTAMLKQARDPKREPRPGVDSSSIWLEGYLIAPSPLPGIVTPDSPCAITWQGRSGRFFLEFTAVNPYLDALGINLVNKLRGYFQPGSFVVEGPPWMPPAGGGELLSAPLPASTNLSALRMCALSQGLLVYASNDNPEHAFATLGLLTEAVEAGQTTRLVTGGPVSDPSWSWSVGQPIFLGENGALTQTPPETGFLLRVALPVSPTQIQIDIDDPIFID